MADTTKLTSFILGHFFNFALIKGSYAADLTFGIKISNAFVDKDAAVNTGNFLLNTLDPSTNKVERFYVPASGVSTDGLTLGIETTGELVRGLVPTGHDLADNDTDLYAFAWKPDMIVAASADPIILTEFQRVFLGLLATGGLNFVMGDETDSICTIKQKGTATTLGWLRKNPTAGKAQFSNDGTNWVNFDNAGVGTISWGNALNGGAAGAAPFVEMDNDVAYLTGGTSAQGTFGTWGAVTDGSFRISIDGTAYNVDGIDFTGVGSMANVATKIQTALRVQTGDLVTVAWSTDHFIITSVDFTTSSAVTVTSASTGTTGTDISGAGGADWMDADTGNGTATAMIENSGLEISNSKLRVKIKAASGITRDGDGLSLTEEDQTNEDIATGENITAGNALRMKLDGKVYKTVEDPERGVQQEIITANDAIGVAVCQIDTDKVVYVYHTGTQINAKVLTWDGAEWTAGSEKEIDADAGAVTSNYSMDVISHATDAFTVTQWDDAAGGVDEATAWACTVSGTTITAGSPTIIANATQTAASAHRVCKAAAGKVAFAYCDTAASTLEVRAGTIATTTITTGSSVEVSAADTDEILDITDIGTDKVVTVYRDAADDLIARVATISTTTLTQGTALELVDAITATNIKVAKMEDDKFVVSYYDGSKSYLIVCTVSTTTITKGTPVEISNHSEISDVLYISDNKVAIVYNDDLGIEDTSYLNYAVGWVSATGTVPVIHQIARLDDVLSEGGIAHTLVGITKVNDDMFQVVTYDTTGFDIYTINIADNNFIGYANANATAPTAVQVNFVENLNQSSLVPGAKYYLADSGAIALTGLVPAGTAVAATKIVK